MDNWTTVCVLNQHAVWYSYNAEQSVDSTSMRVIVSCQNYMHKCENHTNEC
jgi:hypothetical protein